MGDLGNLQDFMLIVTAAQQSADFHPRVRAALRLAAAMHPEISWRADFDVGPREHVEVFSAPDSACARQIADAVALEGLHAECAPLRNGW